MLRVVLLWFEPGNFLKHSFMLIIPSASPTTHTQRETGDRQYVHTDPSFVPFRAESLGVLPSLLVCVCVSFGLAVTRGLPVYLSACLPVLLGLTNKRPPRLLTCLPPGDAPHCLTDLMGQVGA